MNDIRRTILWVIFGFSMVLLWDQWQLFNGNKATFFPSPTPVASSKAPAPASTASVPAGPVGSGAVPAPAASPAAAVSPGAVPASTPSAGKQRLVVSTDLLTLTFDTEGGTLVGSAFPRLKDVDGKTDGFVLLDESAARVLLLWGGGARGLDDAASRGTTWVGPSQQAKGLTKGGVREKLRS